MILPSSREDHDLSSPNLSDTNKKLLINLPEFIYNNHALCNWVVKQKYTLIGLLSVLKKVFKLYYWCPKLA